MGVGDAQKCPMPALKWHPHLPAAISQRRPISDRVKTERVYKWATGNEVQWESWGCVRLSIGAAEESRYIRKQKVYGSDQSLFEFCLPWLWTVESWLFDFIIVSLIFFFNVEFSLNLWCHGEQSMTCRVNGFNAFTLLLPSKALSCPGVLQTHR